MLSSMLVARVYSLWACGSDGHHLDKLACLRASRVSHWLQEVRF